MTIGAGQYVRGRTLRERVQDVITGQAYVRMLLAHATINSRVVRIDPSEPVVALSVLWAGIGQIVPSWGYAASTQQYIDALWSGNVAGADILGAILVCMGTAQLVGIAGAMLTLWLPNNVLRMWCVFASGIWYMFLATALILGGFRQGPIIYLALAVLSFFNYRRIQLTMQRDGA
jgi:hypothetical protein